MDGKHVITIEGIGNTKRPHPTQERIAKGNGSQCGFCTPGIVMSLYAMLRNNDSPTKHDVEEAFDGNLCRCTGYRPILDAANTFSVEQMFPNGKPAANGDSGCCGGSDTSGGCCKSETNGTNGTPNGTNGTNGTSNGTNGVNGSSNGTNGVNGSSNGTNGVNGSSNGTNGVNGSSNGTNGVNGSSNGTNGTNGHTENGVSNGAPKASGGCCMDNGNGPPGGCCMSKKNLDDQPIKRFNPPGFIEYNPDTELIFPPALKKYEMRPLAFGNKRKKWYRPTTLQQLLQIKAVHPQAKIIGGSSETQIEIKFKALQYPVSVFVGDIPELRQYEFTDEHVEVGGNVILTDLEGICEKAMEHYGSARSQVFEGMLKQLKFFAGRQIRNVGTPAGNLATASPISDLNPALWAANAVLVTKSATATTEIPMSSFFTGYRKTALAQDAIIASIRIPVMAAKNEFYRAYKQAKRKDDDIAIVTAALRVKLDDNGIVTDSSLIYGGMNAFTIGAKTAMAYLQDRKFAELETLEGVMSALGTDFEMKFSVPGGMASYRKALAFGFFYRFYHDVLTILDGQSKHVDKQAIEEIERVVSYGNIDTEAAAAYKKEVTGQADPHVAAVRQTTGEAQYTDDIPPQKNELYGGWVLSTKARAKIRSIDYSKALEMPGVIDYIDKNDMPSKEANKFGPPHFDEVFFAEDEVFSAGQAIAMILATSASRAQDAARAVVIEYEVLPSILTIEEAVEQESYHPVYREIKKGNTEEAFQKCDHVFTGNVRMGGQEHFYLETNACVAVPKREDGEIELFASTQNANET